jgi:hypothetical protein
VSATAPELLVVVDTEEEFDWTKPFDRDSTGTRSIPAQARAQALYEEMGIVPTYVVTYPVACDPVAVAYLKRLQDEGRAEIGAHLHPWVTPPHREDVSVRNSYECNLPAALERAKLEALTDAIESSFGRPPTAFKAGRYGFGPNTAEILADLGYRVDCSMLPRSDLRGDGGPDFRHAPDEPFWLNEAAGLLEVPVTTGFMGLVPSLGRAVSSWFDSPRVARLRLPGMLSRSGLVTRSRLTPEGVSAAEQCRLLDALVKQGRRTFSLVYHSPSLAPGNTPYVADETELARFLASLAQVLTHFRDTLGGSFTTLSAVHARMTRPRVAETRSQSAPPAVVGAVAGAAARG